MSSAIPSSGHLSPRNTLANWCVLAISIVGLSVGPASFLIRARETSRNGGSTEAFDVAMFWSHYLPAISLLLATCAVDMALGPQFLKNLSSLNRNGYTTTHVIVNGLALLLLAEALVTVLIGSQFDQLVVRVDVNLIVKVGLFLAIAELYFFPAHRWMHRRAPWLHIMHH